MQGYQDVQDKQLMQYPLASRSKWRTLQNFRKFLSPSVQTSGYVTTTQVLKSWSNIEELVVPFERNLCGHLLAALLWRRQFEKVFLEIGWEKSSKLGLLACDRQQGFFSCLCSWMTSFWLDRSKISISCGRY